MKPESWFNRAIACAGLVAGVVLAWALLLVSGRLDGVWLLAGFMAIGMGVLVIGSIDRVLRRAAEPEAASRPAQMRKPVRSDQEASAGAESAAAPRLKVLLVSSCLEAVAVALLASYYSGSMAIAAAAGVIAAGLAVGVSLLLARSLGAQEEAPHRGAPKARKGSGT